MPYLTSISQKKAQGWTKPIWSIEHLHVDELQADGWLHKGVTSLISKTARWWMCSASCIFSTIMEDHLSVNWYHWTRWIASTEHTTQASQIIISLARQMLYWEGWRVLMFKLIDAYVLFCTLYWSLEQFKQYNYTRQSKTRSAQHYSAV